MMQLNCVIS